MKNHKGIQLCNFIVPLAIIFSFFVMSGIGCGGGGGDGGAANTLPAQCQDGVDNDADGWVDAEDPECGNGLPESGFGLTQCNDGSDNDVDGDTDSADAQCVNALDDDESGGGAVVGSAGGTVSSDDGKVSVTIPPGALSEDTTIGVTPLSNTPSGGIGKAYNFTPDGTTFDLPVILTIYYDDLDIPVGLAESGISLATFVNNHQWRYMLGATVDTSANTVTGTTSSFSTYGLMIGSFEATLDGLQVVPATASSAIGSALFSIDSDNNILAYNISLSALEGTEISATIHGPANAGINAPIRHTLVSGSPKVGIWKYDESLEEELLSGEMYVSISTSQYAGGEIRGQIEPSSASMTPSDVTVRIHRWNDLVGSGPVTGVPVDVDSVVINITAPDMTQIAATADLSTGSIVQSLSVPKGGARLFEALAYDVSDQLLYKAYTYVDIFDPAHIVTLSMIKPTDSTPPSFAGLTDARKVSGDAVALTWTGGTDDTASSLELIYLIYVSKSSGSQNFTAPDFVTDPGETVYTINGLAMGTTYHYVVRSMDPAGNIDTNSVEVSSSTYSGGTGLYVDVNSGADDPSCGASGDPCKTITYTLTKTAGNESIYIAKGVYDNTTGESFPLTLKTGTSLLGDLVFIQVFPTSSGNVHRGTLMPATVIRTAAATTSSVIVGADGAYIHGIKVDCTQTKTYSILAVDGSGKSLFMSWSALYGAPDSTLYPSGIKMGAGSKIKHSLITDFKDKAVWSFGGASTISHTVIKNSGKGLLAYDSHIYRNTIENNTFGVFPQGVDSLVYCNYIGRNYQGIGNVGPGTEIESNWIVNNETEGIQIISTDDTVDPVIVTGNHIVNNGIGILLWNKGKAVIKGNDLICNNYVDFGTWGSLEIDVRHNRWDNNPPTLDNDAGSNLDGCGDVDICYAETYAGTPMPVYLPTNGTESCGSVAISPIL